MVKVVNNILLSSDSGNVSILALLDLSAAFDTIDHEILIDRLTTTFGCSGIVLSWFKSYLAERTQSVVIDGVVSVPSALEYGVPQGSVLGPVLFTMYTFTLSDAIKSHGISYHLYADDCQLYASAAPNDFPRLADKIGSSIECVCSWMANNKLKMNEDKTEVIKIGTLNKLKKS